MSTLNIIKRTLSEAEGGGTSVEGKKDLANQKKRAQILLKSADLRLKQQKEREALARQKSAVKEEAEEVVAEGSGFDKWADDRAASQLHKLKPGMVQDRKTGKWYDPKKEFDKKMNSPEVMAQMKRMATKEEAESLGELSSKKLSDYSDKASDDVHRLDKEGNTKKADKRVDAVVRASEKMTDNGKKLRGTPMKEEEKKMKGDDPCWDGYEMIGKKMKNGKEVPNCVPKEGVKEETIAESGGVKVFKSDEGHIEKYGENNFAVYLDGKRQKAYDSLEAAKKALASGKEKDDDMEDLDEASKYQIYHPSYSSAVQHAISQAEKQGFTVDMDDYTQKVAFGPKKPSAGKTNSFSITLMDKSGKISKKQLHMQVYGMEGGKYELNMYTEDLDESQVHTAGETVKHYMKGEKTKSGVAKWVAQTIDKKKQEMKEAEEFKQGGKPLEKKFEKSFKAMGVDAKVKMKTTNNVSINEEEKEKPKKSFKDMKKKSEKTSDKDIKAGEKLSGKQEPIDLKPTVDNNK